MGELEIQDIEGADGLRILSLRGPLILNTLFEFQDLVRKVQYSRLIIDLAGVPYMDSAGLGAILGAFASSQHHSRRFALSGVSPRILTLLQVTHVDTLLPSFETPEAVQAHWAAKSATA
jgi:anti-sigma B factor antagonist